MDLVVKPNTISVETLVKVAEIAIMCVHSEKSKCPSMGDVLQALKLACSQFEE